MDVTVAVADYLQNRRTPTEKEFMDASGIDDKKLAKAYVKAIDSVHAQLDEFRGTEFTDKDPKWLRNTISRTIDDAQKENRTELRFKITDPAGDLHRSEGVEKWYSETVFPTLNKIAKEKNLPASYDNSGYLTIELKGK